MPELNLDPQTAVAVLTAILGNHAAFERGEPIVARSIETQVAGKPVVLTLSVAQQIVP